MCTALYMETIHYFNYRNTNVYSCLLDASKTFDKVYYGKLFRLLIKRKLPFIVIRLLLDSYLSQSVCVAWDGCRSRSSNTYNGVKQGGVLSPLLFIVYIDELISQLHQSGIGCYIDDTCTYVGVLGYADDITLLCPSIHCLNMMLYICKQIASNYLITFNCKKTV